MTGLARVFVASGMALGLVLVGLAAPRLVAACICGPVEDYPADIVFVGTVIELPGNGSLSGHDGIYRFEVAETRLGDPADGRVFVAGNSTSCMMEFGIGATYLVRARRVDPAANWDGYGRPGVPVATSSCMGSSIVTPATVVSVARVYAVPIAVVVVSVAAVTGARLLMRRRSGRGSA
jgi:hypothetical protein